MTSNNRRAKHIFLVMLILFVASLAVLVISILNRSFAEWYSNNVSSVIRKFLSLVTGFFTISLAELVLYSLPIILVITVVYVVTRVRQKRFVLSSFLMRVFSLVFLLAFLFINTFAACYFRKPLEENLGLSRKALSRGELYESATYLKQQLENSVDAIEFTQSGASDNPHTWSEMDRVIDYGYDELCNEYPFITSISSKPKKIIISPLMTYTHISGIYMPFTGEANVNTNYPDYVVAFTVAHEKAHQRGIAGEDEANFVAFMALLASGDEYFRYAALLTMYDYFLDSVYIHDKEMYSYLLDNTHKLVLGEMYSYSEFFEKYRNSKASKVADNVNDVYLKTMGEENGVESYGMVVELFSAYIEKNNGLPY